MVSGWSLVSIILSIIAPPKPVLSYLILDQFFFAISGHTTLRRKSVRPSPMEAARLEPQKIDSRPKSFAKLPVFQNKSNKLFIFEKNIVTTIYVFNVTYL